MSQENIELVKAIYAAWAERRRGDEFMAADIRYINPPYALEQGTHEGSKSFNRIFEVYSQIRFEIDRLIEAGEDRVVMAGTMHGTARRSALEMTRPHAQVWTIRDGKATSMQWFHSEAEALEAAGLPE